MGLSQSAKHFLLSILLHLGLFSFLLLYGKGTVVHIESTQETINVALIEQASFPSKPQQKKPTLNAKKNSSY